MIFSLKPGMLAIAAALACAPGPVLAQAARSAYTDHDYERCRRLPAPSAAEEDVVSLHRCEGYAGIPVTHWNGPDSSNLAFGREGLVDDYDQRFAFSVAGHRIEWRGQERSGRIAPFAAIVRFQLCRSVGGPCRPELVVFRLESTRRSCLAASVNGARSDANERARAIADEAVRGFRCGVDRPRAPE